MENRHITQFVLIVAYFNTAYNSSKFFSAHFAHLNTYFLRATAATGVARLSHHNSVCLFVRHIGQMISQNGAS